MSGLCPACGIENEDLAHLWWSCRAEQYAHIREKALQRTTLEEMHLAHRDMFLAQKETQLLRWAKNNSGVQSGEQQKQRQRGRQQENRWKIVEELGGYFCDERLQFGRMALVTIRAGKRYRERRAVEEKQCRGGRRTDGDHLALELNTVDGKK